MTIAIDTSNYRALQIMSLNFNQEDLVSPDIGIFLFPTKFQLFNLYFYITLPDLTLKIYPHLHCGSWGSWGEV